MREQIKRKLHQHIEFAASSHHGAIDPRELVGEILAILPSPDQTAILNEAIFDAVRAWIKSRVAKPNPTEQQVFPDFPHAPQFIRSGRHAVALEHATVREVEAHYQKLKQKVKALEETPFEQTVLQLREARDAELQAARTELEEFSAIRKTIKKAARDNPQITVGELIARKGLGREKWTRAYE